MLWREGERSIVSIWDKPPLMVKFRFSTRKFQRKKTLIAKEMANRAIHSTGELRAHGSRGGCLQWAECD